MLTANRTYYVRTDGNEANTGLADTSAAAFLTVQKAAIVAQGLDANGFTITIQVGDGTYTAGATFRGPVPGSTADPAVTIRGNSGTPGNVVINAASGYCFIAQWGARIRVQDMELRNSAAGACLYARGGTICFANIRFGASTGGHIEANINGEIYNSGNYSIVGGAVSHLHAPASGNIAITSATVTLTGTPAFSAYFAGAAAGVISIASVTYSGSATGTRYLSHKGALIDTGTGNASFLPGNAAGSVATNGQYL
ncbi:hypothetical protein N7E70_007190 [Aminobacter sp. NyZ550]|uniref:hypothetical protein n=1 Tax=Aminobacter sp. NyZ550 TaxID=2979870 RepID=UPI0021D5DDF9|nr:hypothetical protein [Aminobacter sp. NyZ550]WAX96638.1 hypothetical protein N7E70_007190 [Aminobacter sp. NyZ550]